ncbi:MAG: hypothetical protein ACOZNI_30375 [Myxococcota bacterium]
MLATLFSCAELLLTDVQLVTRKWVSDVALLDLIGARAKRERRTVLICSYRWSYPWAYTVVDPGQVAQIFLVGAEVEEALEAKNPPQ